MPCGRICTSVSPVPPASTVASSAPAGPSAVAGRSTMPPQAPGYSAAATRARPQRSAWCGSVTSSAPGVCCRVAHHRGAPGLRASTAWRAATSLGKESSVSANAKRLRTPSTGPSASASVSAAVSSSRPRAAGSPPGSTSRAPCRSSAASQGPVVSRAAAGRRTSQRPGSGGVRSSATAVHSVR